MKFETIALPTLYAFVALFTLSCSESGHDHDHEHAHGDHDEDHDDHKGHGDDHAEDGDHDHTAKQTGPNGGRVITSLEPHIEFLVMDDRKVRLTVLDEAMKPAALAGLTASAMAGDRSAPTKLAFAADGESLLSEATLPEGNDFPIVLTLNAPDAEAVREKFNVDLEDCPTCDYREYACICDHGEDGHDHDEKE